VIIKSNLRNGVPIAIRSESQVKILEGVTEAIGILHAHGFIPIVVSNQPDIARGDVTIEAVQKINNRISIETSIEHFFVCPHDDVDQCSCRKPKTGLIQVATSTFQLDLSSCFLVGDRWRDIDLGNALGIKSYFINYSYNEKKPNPPFVTVGSLLEAVKHHVEEDECKRN
jgi:D-glycero-D-manno-heptose 1,7-bisphosphate phosphatase